MKYTSAILVLCNYLSAFLYVTTSEINEINKYNFNILKNGCNTNTLVAYKVVLHTYWTREVFPKHYPDWRPPAQWSKTVGKTHDASFNLFSIGKVATSGVKVFAETGHTDNLEAQSLTGTFEEFSAPAIVSGSDSSKGNFFADDNHTLVSFITKIIPSPDWFIGVDSLELCVNGSWINTTTLELHPLDTGTDNGFTFTAPDWPTEPVGIIYRITSGYPAHQAGSFFYPQIKQLTPIASVTFIKLREYKLTKTFYNTEYNVPLDTMKMALIPSKAFSIIPSNELSFSEEEELKVKETFNRPKSNVKDEKRSKLLEKINQSINPSKNAVDKHNSMTKTKQLASSKKQRTQTPKDCRVNSWSDWSACSKSCGIGEMQRYRKIVRH